MWSLEISAPFLIDRNFTFFTPLDIFSTVLGVAIILVIANVRKRRNRDLTYYRYYTPAILFKFLFVIANCIFYIVAYKGGGDSIGFWDGAVKLNHLFWENPFGYFEELWRSDEARTVYKNFTVQTGYPDGRIYQENESFFISKLASALTFFTFKGYLLMSLIVAFITTNASMRLFELVRSFGKHKEWHVALAVFFIPSLSFWCGGISKDTIMWICICYFLHNFYQIISIERKSSYLHWLGVALTLYVMLQVRSFMVVTVITPLVFAYGVQLRRKFGPGTLQARLTSLLILVVSIAGVLIFLQSSYSQKMQKEAEIINKDMTTNKTYGDKRYDLGITDFSTAGMITAAPTAIAAGLYRPFIWESLSVSLFLNGIESILLMFFTARFFYAKGLGKRIGIIRNHEFLIYAFFFAIILAFFAGFTSILFGVLVRFKAPVLPFIVILLTATIQTPDEVANETEHPLHES
jgi:hypothetical protein